MTTLSERIAEAIRRDGPIGVDRYWDMALFDPIDGYYSRGEAIGRSGDFTTAPEISQLFGELIGTWVATAWAGLGKPDPFVLAELGPGHGTLMADMVRTLRKVAPACLKATRIRMIETSDRLAARQFEALERFDLPVVRCKRFEETEDLPTIAVGNEFFDALAIRQYVFADGRWCERRVALSDDPAAPFRFEPGPVAAGLDEALARGGLPRTEDGAILELSPAREAVAATIAARLAARGGAGLFIDYGHAATAYGDTLQAMRDHAYAPALAAPGAVDITSHVDFKRLATPFARAGLHVARPVEQGAFLLAMGLLERAGQLGAPLDADARQTIRSAVDRLAGSGAGGMGSLFKVLAIAARPIDCPPFATA